MKLTENLKHFSTTFLGLLLAISLLPDNPDVMNLVKDVTVFYPQLADWLPQIAKFCQACGSIYLIFGVGRKLRGSIS